MNTHHKAGLKSFIVVGVSHQNADVSERERFSLSEAQSKKLTHEFQEQEKDGIFVLSTCNRTEIYALTENTERVISLFLNHSRASREDYDNFCYLLKNEKAVRHLFKVSVGLESQILGDFEIIGQIKKAFRLSKEWGAANAFTERLLNTVSQSSKEVKNETDFSSGIASVAYAAVNYVRQQIKEYGDKKVLLYGTGKIGQNVCENLIKHIPKEHVTIVNRSENKAVELASKFDISLGKHQNLKDLICESDIVIVSTGASTATVLPDMVSKNRSQHFIDLSMPRNVSPLVSAMEHIDYITLDDLSKIADETLNKRKEQTDLVYTIIERHVLEFHNWLQQRRYVPTICAIQAKFENIQKAEIKRHKKETETFDEDLAMKISSDIIQKFTNQLSNQLKSVPSDQIELVHHLFKIDSKNL